jgi:hypothetical protein
MAPWAAKVAAVEKKSRRNTPRIIYKACFPELYFYACHCYEALSSLPIVSAFPALASSSPAWEMSIAVGVDITLRLTASAMPSAVSAFTSSTGIPSLPAAALAGGQAGQEARIKSRSSDSSAGIDRGEAAARSPFTR